MPRRNWREGNQPWASTRSGISAGGNTAGPSITTRCSPTRRSGMVRARRHGIGGGGAGHHQAGGVQDAGAVCALDRLVDRLGEAEIVGGEEDASHVRAEAGAATSRGRSDRGRLECPSSGGWFDMRRATAGVPRMRYRHGGNMRAVSLGFKSPSRIRRRADRAKGTASPSARVQLRQSRGICHDPRRHRLGRASRTEKAQALDAAAQLVVRGRRYWLQLTPRSWNALCWMVVGLVTMVSG